MSGVAPDVLTFILYMIATFLKLVWTIGMVIFEHLNWPGLEPLCLEYAVGKTVSAFWKLLKPEQQVHQATRFLNGVVTEGMGAKWKEARKAMVAVYP